MAKKILKFPQQLALPLVWWAEPALWEGHYTASTISRPAEDEALENILIASKLKRGRMKTHLDPIERKVYILELKSFKECPRYFNEVDRRNWIAERTGIGIQAIIDILKNVDLFALHETLISEAESNHRKLVKEVMFEESGKLARAA